jgi:hypothetical protein
MRCAGQAKPAGGAQDLPSVYCVQGAIPAMATLACVAYYLARGECGWSCPGDAKGFKGMEEGCLILGGDPGSPHGGARLEHLVTSDSGGCSGGKRTHESQRLRGHVRGRDLEWKRLGNKVNNHPGFLGKGLFRPQNYQCENHESPGQSWVS